MTASAFNLGQKVGVSLVRGRRAENFLRFRDPIVLLHYRRERLIGCYKTLNDITNQGKNNIFDVYFNTATQTPNNSWYVGLIDASGYTALAATDTMAAHGGWTEFVGYTQANRVAWGSGSSTGQSVTNATPCQFDINTAGTIKGVFVVTNNAKSGNTGILWATALFGADVPVTNGDQLKVTYTVAA